MITFPENRFKNCNFLQNMRLFLNLSKKSVEPVLNRAQHNRRIRVRQSRSDALADALRFSLISWLEFGDGVENEDLSPFCTFVQRRQKFVDDRFCQKIVSADFGQRGDGVRDDHRIRIRKKILQSGFGNLSS